MPKDTLARGAKQASFGSMCHISQDKWDAMFKPDTTVDAQKLSTEKEKSEK